MTWLVVAQWVSVVLCWATCLWLWTWGMHLFWRANYWVIRATIMNAHLALAEAVVHTQSPPAVIYEAWLSTNRPVLLAHDWMILRLKPWQARKMRRAAVDLHLVADEVIKMVQAATPS